MKGTRTYQIVGILVVFALVALVQVFEADIGFGLDEIKVLGEKGEDVLGALMKMYVAFLAIWKVANPHPMKHEQKE